MFVYDGLTNGRLPYKNLPSHFSAGSVVLNQYSSTKPTNRSKTNSNGAENFVFHQGLIFRFKVLATIDI